METTMMTLAIAMQGTEPAPTGSFDFGTVYQLILDGGWMMAPIGLCSIAALTFLVERSGALRRGKLFPKKFVDGIGPALDEGEEQALELCGQTRSPVARMFEAGLRRWGAPLQDLERAVEDAGAREVARLSANLRPLTVVATVSPLLGLLGTVIGMIKAFQVIAVEKGIGKPELLAEGISQALVTTAAGLIVAIPAQVAYFYLKSKIDRFIADSERLYSDTLGRRVEAQIRQRAA